MRSLVGLRGVDASHLRRLIALAASLRQQVQDGNARLGLANGKAVALMFMEPSTRTRFSFEMACLRLGADPLAFSAAGSSTTKGETLLDTARVLRSVGADAIVVRDKGVGVPRQLDRHLDIPVINAGDGINEHPTQALLDLLTLTDNIGDVAGKTIAIVGDVRHSRVARSNCFGLVSLGARVILAGPATLCPDEMTALGVEVRHRIDDVLEEADAVMMLRIQRERLGRSLLASEAEYTRYYGLTAPRLTRLKPGAVVLHPAPMNRGVEISDAAADGPRSVIFPQMANGVFVRMAVLATALEAVS